MSSKCMLCGSHGPEVLVRKGADYEYAIPFEADVLRCGSCGLLWQSPVPGDSDLAGYYPPDYANYSEPSSQIVKLLVRITEDMAARSVRSLIGQSGRVLDVGCADGHYLRFMSERGQWELEGLEITGDAASKARAMGFRVHVGPMESTSLPSESFDLVRMNHIIEHVTRPREAMLNIHCALKPGGYLVLETPNTSCLDLKIMGRYWGALHLPRHIYLFNRKTISMLASQCGFDVRSITTTLMTTGWALGLQNFIQSRWPRKLKSGRMRSYPLLLVGFLPLTALQKLAGNSTMMSVVLRKPGGLR